ncbi:hypothetical protein BC629DRAFT_235569 [Irpex lacteus]|nr:hypothetical protein BC629DRAFT_235569 [Irpex lacteus]
MPPILFDPCGDRHGINSGHRELAQTTLASSRGLHDTKSEKGENTALPPNSPALTLLGQCEPVPTVLFSTQNTSIACRSSHSCATRRLANFLCCCCVIISGTTEISNSSNDSTEIVSDIARRLACLDTLPARNIFKACCIPTMQSCNQ